MAAATVARKIQTVSFARTVRSRSMRMVPGRFAGGVSPGRAGGFLGTVADLHIPLKRAAHRQAGPFGGGGRAGADARRMADHNGFARRVHLVRDVELAVGVSFKLVEPR